MPILEISQSQLKSWRRCHQQWTNRYKKKLRRRYKGRSLMFGSIVHEVMEEFYNKGDIKNVFDWYANNPPKGLLAADKEEYYAAIDDAEDVLVGYFNYWPQRDLKLVKRNGQYAEHKFEVEILPDIIFRGKIDGIGVTPNSNRWLVEHKTFARAPSPDEYWRNLQSVVYIRAMEIMGWPPVVGTCWDFIRNTTPSLPKINQDGSLSKAQIRSLPHIVKRFAKDNKIAKADYEETLARVEAQQEEWYFRVFTPVNKDVVDAVWGDFIATVEEMVDNSHISTDKNIDQHCSWCEYERLCRGELQQLDVEWILRKEYTTDEEKSYSGSKGAKTSSKKSNRSGTKTSRKDRKKS